MWEIGLVIFAIDYQEICSVCSASENPDIFFDIALPFWDNAALSKTRFVLFGVVSFGRGHQSLVR